MRAPRFIETTQSLLDAAQHPAIAKAEPFSDPGTETNPCGIEITLTSGQVVRLKAAMNTGPGGDDFTKPEEIPNPNWRPPAR